MTEIYRSADNDGGKPKYLEVSLSIVTVFIINMIWTALGSNPSIRVANSATNHLEELPEIRQNYVQ
jgi:hypothetical protein